MDEPNHVDEPNDTEIPLAGGNVAESVVRVGDTVRKPWTPSSAGVQEYLAWLAARGVDVPTPLGRDEQGRQAIGYVPGTLAMLSPELDLDELGRVGALVRQIHDASEGFAPSQPTPWSNAIASDGEDLICHGDLAPWNLMLGERWVFIDWDSAISSTCCWDLAYAAQAFTLNDPTQDPSIAGSRLRAFVDGYDADANLRAQMPTAVAQRAAAMHKLLRSSAETGRQPWADMYSSGHGEHWKKAADYAAAHGDVWAKALR